MRRLLAALTVVAALVVVAFASAYNERWGCFDRQADGQCVIRVSIGGGFSDVDERVIREVLADFSRSPNVEVIVDKPSEISIVRGCWKGTCGFYTDVGTRKVYIDRTWSYEWFSGGEFDGMRGVYCHELMHAVAGAGDGDARLEPSCFNGTSPFLGPEDLAYIAKAYPLGP